MSTLSFVELDVGSPLSDVESLIELVDGKVLAKPESSLGHWIASRVSLELSREVHRRRAGTILNQGLFVLNIEAGLALRPDVAVISAERWSFGLPPPPRGEANVVPDLAVEIAVSKAALRRAESKVSVYFRYGVREVWIIVPEERLVQVFRSPHASEVLTHEDSISTELLPGWSVPLVRVLPPVNQAAADASDAS